LYARSQAAIQTRPMDKHVTFVLPAKVVKVALKNC
jgi:hypothetical protein